MHISANTEGTASAEASVMKWLGQGTRRRAATTSRVLLWPRGWRHCWKHTLRNVNTGQLSWAQSWPPMHTLQTAIYRFINKWLDVKSLEDFPFPQQSQEQIITIQVGFSESSLTGRNRSLCAVSKSPRQETQRQCVPRTLSQAKSTCMGWTCSWVKIYYCQ